MEITVASDLRSICRLGVVECEVQRVLERDVALDGPLAQVEQTVRHDPPAEVTAVRKMYRRVGIDPTRTRPSSEALLRRVRRGEPLPRINTLVDVCNWCSLELQLPFGLYDRQAIEPPVELRRGRAGETYAGIRKDEVHVADRLVLSDAKGAFGNPTSDSARTMVTTATRAVAVVIFAPYEYDEEALEKALEITSSRFVTFTAGRAMGRYVVG